mmetsp:Transcript_7941/g.17620  ORF Transcript_7941/g.17620 Transcript_7941/m.17620 type:complete len:599 (-) Transcript_7941:95-1891(-)
MAEYDEDAELAAALAGASHSWRSSPSRKKSPRRTEQKQQTLSSPSKASSSGYSAGYASFPDSSSKSRPKRRRRCWGLFPSSPYADVCPSSWIIPDPHASRLFVRRSKIVKKLEQLLSGETPHHEGASQPWIKTHCADMFFAGVIVLSAIFAGIDVEILVRELETTTATSATLLAAQVLFNVIFCTELLLRMHAEGVSYIFPCNPVGCFDFVVIMLGVVDLIVSFTDTGGSSLRAVGAFRIFRMLRLVRIARLLLICKSLRLLFVAMFASVSAVAWTMVLLAVMIFIGALFCVILLGSVKEVAPYFGTVSLGLFTHFQIVTLEAWPEISDQTMQAVSPLWALYFIVFICLTGMAVTNLVIGIIGEKLMGVREDAGHGEWEAPKAHEERLRSLRAEFQEIFNVVDTTRSGFISSSEALQLLQRPDLRQWVTQLAVSQDISHKELLEVVSHGQQQDQFSSQEIFDGLLRLRGSVGHLHSVILQHEVIQLGQRQIRRATSMEEGVGTQFAGSAAESTNSLSQLLEGIEGKVSADAGHIGGPMWEANLRAKMQEFMRNIDGLVASTEELLPPPSSPSIDSGKPSGVLSDLVVIDASPRWLRHD